MSRRDFVDLTSDETTDIAPPRKQSLGRPASTPLTDRGKPSSHVRVEEQAPRTRTPQLHSQKPTPALTRDKSPPKKSKTTHDTPSSNHDPTISGISIAKSHINNSRVLEAGGDVLRHGTSKHDLAQSGALRSLSPLRSSLSMDTAKDGLSHLPDENFARTSMPPRLTLRGPSGDAPLPTKGYGTRSAGFRSSDTREAEEGSSSDSRSISRRGPTGNPINLLNREFGGESKRRINRSRLGVSFSGQLHIDGEDSDNDNAARAMRHSINAVFGPLRKKSEESEISEEEIIPKTRVASHKKANVATGPRRQRSEGRHSSGNDDLQEAASAQLLNDVLELPAKPDPPRLGLGKLLFPSGGLDNDTTVDETHLRLKTPQKHQRTHKAQKTPNSAMEPTKTETLGEQAQGSISEDDPSLQQTKLVLDDAINSNPVLSKRSVPLGIESLTAMLKRHEIAMWNDQAYLIKPALRQAKLDCIQAAQPKLNRSLPDPFSGILGDSFLPTEKVQIDAKNQSRSKLQSRVFNSAYTQHNDGLIYFDNIEYASTVSAL